MEKTKNNLEAYTLTNADLQINNWENEAINYIQKFMYWDKEEAQTLYHDACILVLDQLKKGQIKSVPKGYLFRTCKNLGANTWRHAQRQKLKYERYCLEEKLSYEQTINSKYGITLFDESSEDFIIDSKKALRAFDLLKDKCQKIISLKYIEDKSHLEITKNLEHINSENSAKTTLSRCIQYWKKIFKKLSK